MGLHELLLGGPDGFVGVDDPFPTNAPANAVLVHDLDADGDLDVLLGASGPNRVLVNAGDATFTDASDLWLTSVDDTTLDLELGDVDGDGDLDLVVANEKEPNRLLIRDGDVFADASTSLPPEGDPPAETREADFGDIDGDGDLDLVFANVAIHVTEADPRNCLLINDGTGVFADESDARLPADDDFSMDADFIDVDDDGDLDLLTANYGSLTAGKGRGPYRVYLNDGSGVFIDATESVFPSGIDGHGWDIEAGDLDADGRIDLYLASGRSADRLLFGQ